MKFVYFVAFCLTVAAVFVQAGTINPKLYRDKNAHLYVPLGEEQSSFWLDGAKEFITRQLNKKTHETIAKNVIIFMGAGMSMTTQAVTRPYIGGVEKYLSFEQFPSVGMAKTYCVDAQTADSACASTALLSGSKSNAGTIGVTAAIQKLDCLGSLDTAAHTVSIAKWAMDAGKVSGFVTTSSVTASGPANIYAHSASSRWHNDADVWRDNCDPEVNEDIARQLVLGEVGSKLRVILGGGRRNMRGRSVLDEEHQSGARTDGRDLIDEWTKLKKNLSSSYVWNATDLMAVDAVEIDYLLGLFESAEMKYHLDIVAENLSESEPTLTQMTEKAIDILSKNENGFFLFVESGRIDDAHHSGYARMALDETAELSKAVEMARQKLSINDTLIIVTSDHSHTLTYNGYPVRKSDIFGSTDDEAIWSTDGIPYMTLSYANGPGYLNHMNTTSGQRIDPLTIDTKGNRFQFPATAPLDTETHGGDDVAVYASGPWAHIFSGSYEQSVVPYMAAYASCIGLEQSILNVC